MSQPFKHPELDIEDSRPLYPNVSSVCGLLGVIVGRKLLDLRDGSTLHQEMPLPTDEECAERALNVATIATGTVAIIATITQLPLL
jgi:hypothetical protein